MVVYKAHWLAHYQICCTGEAEQAVQFMDMSLQAPKSISHIKNVSIFDSQAVKQCRPQIGAPAKVTLQTWQPCFHHMFTICMSTFKCDLEWIWIFYGNGLSFPFNQLLMLSGLCRCWIRPLALARKLCNLSSVAAGRLNTSVLLAQRCRRQADDRHSSWWFQHVPGKKSSWTLESSSQIIWH